jgi:hypothetical protein
MDNTIILDNSGSTVIVLLDAEDEDGPHVEVKAEWDQVVANLVLQDGEAYLSTHATYSEAHDDGDRHGGPRLFGPGADDVTRVLGDEPVEIYAANVQTVIKRENGQLVVEQRSVRTEELIGSFECPI